MRKLTDFAINSIIDELEERYEEAKKAYEADTTNLANQAAFFCLFTSSRNYRR